MRAVFEDVNAKKAAGDGTHDVRHATVSEVSEQDGVRLSF